MIGGVQGPVSAIAYVALPYFWLGVVVKLMSSKRNMSHLGSLGHDHVC